MKTFLRTILCIVLAITFSFHQTALMSDEKASEGKRIPLWGGKAPLGDNKFENAETWITVHLAEKPNGAAVVICPGGGYGGLVTGPKGTELPSG